MKKSPRRQNAADQTSPALERQALEFLWSADPVRASLLGLEEYDPFLPRTDPGVRTDFRRQAADLLGRLERLPHAPDATPLERAERWAMESLLRVPLVLEEEFSPYTRNPALYLEGLLQGLYILLQRPGRLDQARGRSVLSRLREGVRLLGEARVNLQPHATRVPPCWAQATLRLAAGGKALVTQGAETLRREVPGLAEETESEAARVLRAIEEFGSFVREEILPRARGNFSAGRDLFHFRLREEHRLPYRDVDLLEWGWHEIRETRRELERVGRGIDPGRGWRAILEDLKLDHPGMDGLLPAYRQEVERARRFVREHALASIPEQDLAVEETPEFERSVAPFAAYLPPAPFGRRRRGCLWVTPPGGHLAARERAEALRDHCRFRIPITVLHETYPGHHLQFSHICDLRSDVRRQYTTPVSVEGWALYCEEMMLEQGFLPDPRSRLCQLRDHLWRSCRVVLDVRLHTQSLDLEEAARMLVEEAALQAPNAAAEVGRYTHTPTQPLSYLIGKREIQALRREVERARGTQFRLGEFHDQFLSLGALPLSFAREILLAAAAATSLTPAPDLAPVTA